MFTFDQIVAVDVYSVYFKGGIIFSPVTVNVCFLLQNTSKMLYIELILMKL